MRSSGHIFIQCDLVSLQKRKFEQTGVEGRLREIGVCKRRRKVSEEIVLLTSGPLTSGLHICEKNFTHLGPSVCSTLLWQPWQRKYCLTEHIIIRKMAYGGAAAWGVIAVSPQFDKASAASWQTTCSGVLLKQQTCSLVIPCFSCIYTLDSLAALRPVQSSDKYNFLFKTIYWQNKTKIFIY